MKEPLERWELVLKNHLKASERALYICIECLRSNIERDGIEAHVAVHARASSCSIRVAQESQGFFTLPIHHHLKDLSSGNAGNIQDAHDMG